MHLRQNRVSDNFTTDFTAGAADVAAEYQFQQNITHNPILTLLQETLGYAAGNLTKASAVATVMFFGMGALPAVAANLDLIGKATTLIDAEIQEVPLGFRDEFLRARAERKKNGTNVFRYIQKGNIKGLTDSKQNGIGPGHGKSTSALEAAIASESSRSWEQVRIDALDRALGNQSFNDFSRAINQRQRKAGLPELTAPQMRNFMDVSFWRVPEKGEPDMAKETGDSEYYQLPKLTPSVRSSLIKTKLNYQEQIVNEAVAIHDLTGKRLHDKLTGEQDLPEAEAEFVSDHLDAVRFASPANKTQALLRLGSEPYIRPPGTTPGTPPVTLTPPGAPPGIVIPPDTPPVTLRPPGLPPLLLIPPDTPPVTRRPPGLPPLLLIPPDTPPVTRRPPGLPPLLLIPPDTPPTTPPSTPLWNRPLVVMGAAAIALLPVITDDSGDQSPNTPPSSPTTDSPGDDPNTPASSPTTGSPGDDPNTPASPPTTGSPGDNPNTPASPPTTDSPGDRPNTPPLPPTTDSPAEGFPNTPPLPPTTNPPGEGFPNTPPLPPTTDSPGEGFPNTPPLPLTTDPPGEEFSNTPFLPPTVESPICLTEKPTSVTVLPPLITDLPGEGFPNTPPLPPTVESPICSTEKPTSVLESRPIPEPGTILGLVAAGAGLLAARFKARSSKED